MFLHHEIITLLGTASSVERVFGFGLFRGLAGVFSRESPWPCFLWLATGTGFRFLAMRVSVIFPIPFFCFCFAFFAFYFLFRNLGPFIYVCM